MRSLQFIEFGPVSNLRLPTAGDRSLVVALSDGRAAYEKVARGEVDGRIVLAP
jgi:hypothetical protein